MLLFMSCKKDIKKVDKNFRTRSDEEWVLVSYEHDGANNSTVAVSDVYNEFRFEVDRHNTGKSGPITGLEVGSSHGNLSGTGFPNFGNSDNLRFNMTFVVDDVEGATVRGMIITLAKDSLTSSGYTRIELTREYFTLMELDKEHMKFAHLVAENGTTNEYFTFEKRKK